MLDTTVDQENSAIQGLLALRDCDSLNGSNKSSSPQSFVTTPELNELRISSVSLIEYTQNENKNVSISRHEQQCQTNKPSNLQQKQQEYRDQQAYHAQQAFNAQQIRHSHQFQIVRLSDQSNNVKLPSIKEMISQHPAMYCNRQANPTLVNKESQTKMDYNAQIQRYPNMPSERIDQNKAHPGTANQSVSESQFKNQNTPQYNNQHVHDIHKCKEDIRTFSDSELHVFLSGLRQHYRDEYYRELKSQKESFDKSDSSAEPQNNDTDDTDNEDSQSEYRLSSDDSCASNSDPVFINTNNKRTKIEGSKNCNGSVEKPRWTTEEKLELLDAVIKHKSLNIMATFDWSAIGTYAGRTDKACKDQWRRGILKLFREFVSRL